MPVGICFCSHFGEKQMPGRILCMPECADILHMYMIDGYCNPARKNGRIDRQAGNGRTGSSIRT